MTSWIRWGFLAGGLALCLTGCTEWIRSADRTDAVVLARVQQALQSHPELEIEHLDLDVHSGTVTLSGIVSSQEAHREIVRIIRRVSGVRQVLANLLVGP